MRETPPQVKPESGNEKTPLISPSELNEVTSSHLILPALFRDDKFEDFMVERQKQLLALIESAMGKVAYNGTVSDEGEDAENTPDVDEAELTIPVT